MRGRTIFTCMVHLQVSDLHISKFEHHSRVSDFRELCSKVIPSIDPSLVLVTGVYESFHV